MLIRQCAVKCRAGRLSLCLLRSYRRGVPSALMVQARVVCGFSVVRHCRKSSVVASMAIRRIIAGMSEDMPPTFFIPSCAPEEQEKVYASMARSCNVHVPGPGRRRYAIG